MKYICMLRFTINTWYDISAIAEYMMDNSELKKSVYYFGSIIF